jgi:hypothetical protein
MGWQEPPLNPQPAFVMKAHSLPAFTVAQIMAHSSSSLLVSGNQYLFISLGKTME